MDFLLHPVPYFYGVEIIRAYFAKIRNNFYSFPLFITFVGCFVGIGEIYLLHSDMS